MHSNNTIIFFVDFAIFVIERLEVFVAKMQLDFVKSSSSWKI